MKNDFSKFTCFVRGIIETGFVIKHSDKALRHDVKLHFNRLLHHSVEFEKFLHQQLGTDMAEAEDTINSSIIGLVWQIFDMEEDEVNRFIEYINNFDDHLKKEA